MFWQQRPERPWEERSGSTAVPPGWLPVRLGTGLMGDPGVLRESSTEMRPYQFLPGAQGVAVHLNAPVPGPQPSSSQQLPLELHSQHGLPAPPPRKARIGNLCEIP